MASVVSALVCLAVTANAQQFHANDKESLETFLLALDPLAGASATAQSKAEQVRSRIGNARMLAVDEPAELFPKMREWEVPTVPQPVARAMRRWQEPQKRDSPGEYREIQKIGAKPARVQHQKQDSPGEYWEIQKIGAKPALVRQQKQDRPGYYWEVEKPGGKQVLDHFHRRLTKLIDIDFSDQFEYPGSNSKESLTSLNLPYDVVMCMFVALLFSIITGAEFSDIVMSGFGGSLGEVASENLLGAVG
jgi:hypothetical protein